MNIAKTAVIVMGVAIGGLGTAVVYGMLNPPHAAPRLLPARTENLTLPVGSFTMLPPAGDFLVAEAEMNGKKMIFLIDPATLTIHGTVTGQGDR